MPRRKSLMLFTVLFAMAALFVSTGVMAAGTDCSDAQDLTCWRYDLGYTITYNRIYTGSNGNKCFEWNMEKQKKTNINHVHLGIASSIALAPIASSDTNATEIHAACEGATQDNVLVGDCNNQVVTYTPNFPTGLFTMRLCLAGPYQESSVAAIVTASTAEEFGGIFGPSTIAPVDPPAGTEIIDKISDPIGTASLSVFLDGNNEVIEVLDENNDAVIGFDITNNMTCTITDPNTGATQTGTPSFMSNASFIIHSSPGCVYEIIGGTLYRRCPRR